MVNEAENGGPGPLRRGNPPWPDHEQDAALTAPVRVPPPAAVPPVPPLPRTSDVSIAPSQPASRPAAPPAYPAPVPDRAPTAPTALVSPHAAAPGSRPAPAAPSTRAEASSRAAARAAATTSITAAAIPTAATPAPVPAPPQAPTSAPAHAPAVAPLHPRPEAPSPTIGAVDTAPPAQALREQGPRRSFLQQEPRDEPARLGGRGALNRFGFHLAPNPQERAVREDEHAVSRHWPGPRTIAIVNGKGGAGKTPTTVLLAAVFAHYGGAGVLAWDNNQTRGTLGWRTETGPHDRTLLELLPQTQRLLGAQGQSADLAHFVHHQPQEKYDVLRSQPIRLADENRLSPADVDAIHAVAAKFYRLIVIDSGNDESDPMWLRMIDHADQLVVATTTRGDHAEAGALLLEALAERDEHSARLASGSVVVVGQADPRASAADLTDVVVGYQPLARAVVPVPFDREMVDGHLRLRTLAAPTQRAWLAAAAAVARGF